MAKVDQLPPSKPTPTSTRQDMARQAQEAQPKPHHPNQGHNRSAEINPQQSCPTTPTRGTKLPRPTCGKPCGKLCGKPFRNVAFFFPARWWCIDFHLANAENTVYMQRREGPAKVYTTRETVLKSFKSVLRGPPDTDQRPQIPAALWCILFPAHLWCILFWDL